MEEKIKQIIHYIKNYEQNKIGNILNFYKIFELVETSDILALQREIKTKKLKILFHPDLLAYIPANYQKDFEILSESIKDMENIFSDEKLKLKYDENLKKEAVKRLKPKNENFKKASDLERLNSIVLENIKKHGFKFTSEALEMIIGLSDFRGITNTGDSRNKAIKLGSKKIETILNFFTPKNCPKNNLNAKIVNYYSKLIHQNYELKEIYDAYVNACETTALKYGIYQVSEAINECLDDNHEINNKNQLYSGFTNDKDARKKIIELVKPVDIIMLSRIYLYLNKKDLEQESEIFSLSDKLVISRFLEVLESSLQKQNTKYYR